MSIFTQEPQRRRTRMSGLGALASMLPALNAGGTGVFLDANVCDFDALVQRVAAELGMRQQYAGKPALAQHDAAIYAHEIWLANCPSAQTYVTNNYYDSAASWGRGGDHRRGHGWRRHPHDMTASSAHGSPPSVMALQPMPSSRSSAPMSLPTRVTPRHASYSAAPSTAHPRYQAQQHAVSQAPRSGGRSHGMRGLGDGDQIVGPLDARTLRMGPASLPQVRPQTIQQIQTSVAAHIQPLMSTDIPVDGASAMPSLSIEGALPGGVAFLLAGALGLLGASFLFGGK